MTTLVKRDALIKQDAVYIKGHTVRIRQLLYKNEICIMQSAGGGAIAAENLVLRVVETCKW